MGVLHSSEHSVYLWVRFSYRHDIATSRLVLHILLVQLSKKHFDKQMKSPKSVFYCLVASPSTSVLLSARLVYSEKPAELRLSQGEDCFARSSVAVSMTTRSYPHRSFTDYHQSDPALHPAGTLALIVPLPPAQQLYQYLLALS
jgi:hypothetical protein